MVNGFLLVDKGSGVTSHDVVAQARKRFGTKRVGHAGTLDPIATGVLVLGIGDATKLLQYVVDGEKGYEATILLGVSTLTDDREGEVLSTTDASKILDTQIDECLTGFVGTIMQRPSSVSAIKINGKRAHQRVRDGEEVDIPAREVTISTIDILGIRHNQRTIEIDISVKCSAGTYIRSIARDLGEALYVGGHLTALRRTLVSPFALTECASLKEAELIPTVDGISRILPIRNLAPEEIVEISFGRVIPPSSKAGPVVALNLAGEYVALLLDKNFSGSVMATPTLVAMKE